MASEAESRASALATALVEELASVMGAMLGHTGSAASGATTTPAAWAVTVSVGQPVAGTLTLGFSEDDCARFVRSVLGPGEAPADATIGDLLRDVVGQAVGALRERPEGQGLLFCVETPGRTASAPATGSIGYELMLGSDFAPGVTVWSALDTALAAAAPPEASTASDRRLLGFSPDRTDRGIPVEEAVPANLDVILDIDLPLSVRFGQAELTLEHLTRLGPGSVIDLRRSPDDPVDVLVNGRLVARAEVVVVGGSYGVRILEIVSTAERVHNLGQGI